MDEILLRIYEARDNGDLSDNEFSSCKDVFMEKKTREEYRKEAFKKKYDFKPDKPGSEAGMITVDGGKRVHIDMNTNTTKTSLASDKNRSVSCNKTYNPHRIEVDKAFFKLKNPKERDALLNHEVGHGKFQSPQIVNNDLVDLDTASVENFIDTLNGDKYAIFRASTKRLGIKPGTPLYDQVRKIHYAEYEELINAYKDVLKNPGKKANLRAECIKIMDKYTTFDHVNPSEIEADLYAANKTSIKDFNRAIRHYAQKQTKEYLKNPEILKKYGLRELEFAKNVSDEDKVKYDKEPDKYKKELGELGKKHVKKLAAESERGRLQRKKALEDKELQKKGKGIYESVDSDLKPLLVELYEACDNGTISSDELSEYKDFITEGKIFRKYTKSSFKKKYKFEPDKPGSDRGTIEVDGKRFKVDMGDSDFVQIDSGYTVKRSTSMDVNSREPELILDGDFFNIKGKKAREAIMRHEIGHAKYHSIARKNPVIDKDMVSSKAFKSYYRGSLSENIKAQNPDLTEDDMGKEMDFIVYKAHIFKKLLPYMMKRGFKKPSKQDIRNECLKVFKEYEKLGTHLTTGEFEADRYAVNKTSYNSFKSGLKQYQNFKIKESKKLSDKALRDEIKRSMNEVLTDESVTEYARANNISKEQAKKELLHMIKEFKDESNKLIKDTLKGYKKHVDKRMEVLRDERLKDIGKIYESV